MLRPVIALLLASAFASQASGECCRLVKVDSETPAVTVQACTPDEANGCGDVLFVGELDLGESATVCAETEVVAYREYDAVVGDYGPFTLAICSGDIEL